MINGDATGVAKGFFVAFFAAIFAVGVKSGRNAWAMATRGELAASFMQEAFMHAMKGFMSKPTGSGHDPTLVATASPNPGEVRAPRIWAAMVVLFKVSVTGSSCGGHERSRVR